MDPTHVGKDQIPAGVNDQVLVPGADPPPPQAKLIPCGQMEQGINDGVGGKVLFAQKRPGRLLLGEGGRSCSPRQRRYQVGLLSAGSSQRKGERKNGVSHHGFRSR